MSTPYITHTGTCDWCLQPQATIALVKVRVGGKATVFEDKSQGWCKRCREANAGHYKILRPIV